MPSFLQQDYTSRGQAAVEKMGHAVRCVLSLKLFNELLQDFEKYSNPKYKHTRNIFKSIFPLRLNVIGYVHVSRVNICHKILIKCKSKQKQTARPAYFSSQQLRMFAFEKQHYAVSSHSSHYPQEVFLAQFSDHVLKGGLKHHSFHVTHDRVMNLYSN